MSITIPTKLGSIGFKSALTAGNPASIAHVLLGLPS
jgi:hypothetical protein